MSVEQLAIVLHHSRLSGAQKLLMVGVANHDGDGGAYPSQLRLATYCGVSDVRNLRRIIDKCVEAGELTVNVQAGGSVNTPEHRRSNLYEINVKCPPNCDRTTQHRLLCWGCDEPLPFARYRARATGPDGAEPMNPAGEPMVGWHKRCADLLLVKAAEPVENVPPGEFAPGGEYAPRPRANTPPEPLRNHLNHDDQIPTEVDVRARDAVDSETCLNAEDGVHEWAMHRGNPWRCTGCGIAWAERGSA